MRRLRVAVAATAVLASSADLSTSLTLTSTCGKWVMMPARSASVRPVAATREASMSPVRVPSPVVPWSSMTTWPDCSPPRA